MPEIDFPFGAERKTKMKEAVINYKTMFYERNLEKEASDEFYDSEDTSYINFQGLVYVGDIIRSTDSFRETVTEVSFDGSFYTETEMTGLYVDGKTTRIK